MGWKWQEANNSPATRTARPLAVPDLLHRHVERVPQHQPAAHRLAQAEDELQGQGLAGNGERWERTIADL